MTNIIVTGGCGFIGHHIVEHLHRHTNWNITIIDKLTYASMGYKRLKSNALLNSDRIRIFTTDLAIPIPKGVRDEIGTVDYILHLAAETHVDNSITNPTETIKNNVMSTTYIVEYAKSLPSLKMFINFSTDEVYGSTEEYAFKEWDRHYPTNPYSASKSASEQICLSYHNTYKLPLITVNVMNAFGERQHTEKFIPKIMKYILEGKKLLIHSGDKVIGSRFYIHARNIASAILFIITNGTIGEKYNIKGQIELNNQELAEMVLSIMNSVDNREYNLHSDVVSYDAKRPGHDLRYDLDGSKLVSMGWKAPVTFRDSLRRTIEWTLQNRDWLAD
jgi:dTDP-glucose 4,6-dehydratase